MRKSFQVSVTLPVKPEVIYEAWLNTKKHSVFTGSPAKIDSRVGGKFSAWDGYITGANLELIPNRRIVQSWRTTEFPSGSPDSKIDVTLTETKNGTKLTLKHSNIPAGQEKEYKQGWKDFYFVPMKKYFEAG